MAQTLRSWMIWLSNRLPGNLRGQGAAGLIVAGVCLYAMLLALIELAGAINLRLTTGSWLLAGNDDDPLLEAGGGLGFYAAQLFTLNFVLATRWRWMEMLFGGAGRVYALHAFAGKTALTFVVLHTGILVVQALPDWTLVASYLLPGRDWAYTLGLVGTLGLVALVTITLWVRLPYRRWLKTHKLMIIPFLGGVLHAIVLQADWYMVLMAAIGSYAWFDSVFLMPRRGIVATVTSARTLGEIRELTLETAQPLRDGHGRFVLVGNRGQRHPFSVSGIADGRIRISARRIGPFTQGLAAIQPGHLLTLHGPFGDFGSQIRSADGAQLWIAGGVGITPFLSALQMVADIAPHRPLELIWSVRQGEDAVYRQEIEAIMSGMTNARLTIHESARQCRVTALTALARRRPDYVFLCGPKLMTEDLHAQLLTAGIAAERITSERFAFR